ncbi:MAG TPA: hypothetical protein VEN82_00640 [Actinomycetota bacterium]|nr:hypothetical protein [Actinomycetota bacterium]
MSTGGMGGPGAETSSGALAGGAADVGGQTVGGAVAEAPVGGRSLRQYRHLMASSWISSAQ